MSTAILSILSLEYPGKDTLKIHVEIHSVAHNPYGLALV